MRLPRNHHRPFQVILQVIAVIIQAVAHAGFPGVFHVPALAGDKHIDRLQEAQVDGRAAEGIVGQVDGRDLADAQLVQPVQFLADHAPGHLKVAPGELVQVFHLAPVAQRIDFHAQDDGQLVIADHLAGFLRRIDDLQPAFARPAGLLVDEIGHFFHRRDLDLDGMFVVMWCVRAGLGGQQLVVDRQAGDQAQPALVGAVDPIDVGLLVDQGGEARPDDELGPAAGGRVAKLRVDVHQPAVDRLAGTQGVLHAFLSGVAGVVGFSPERLAAKGQVRHQVRVRIGKSPQRHAWIGIPIISPQGYAGGCFGFFLIPVHFLTPLSIYELIGVYHHGLC